MLLELHLSVPVDGTELDWVLSEFFLGPVESSVKEEGVEESFQLEVQPSAYYQYLWSVSVVCQIVMVFFVLLLRCDLNKVKVRRIRIR